MVSSAANPRGSVAFQKKQIIGDGACDFLGLRVVDYGRADGYVDPFFITDSHQFFRLGKPVQLCTEAGVSVEANRSFHDLALAAPRVQVDGLAAIGGKDKLPFEDCFLPASLFGSSGPFVVKSDLAQFVGRAEVIGKEFERSSDFLIPALNDPGGMKPEAGHYPVAAALLQIEDGTHGAKVLADGNDAFDASVRRFPNNAGGVR